MNETASPDKTVTIGDAISVGELAEKLEIPTIDLITGLVKSGVMATLNDTIDFDTAQIMVSELGLPVELLHAEADEAPAVTKRVGKRTIGNSVERPPVIAVMGHVDHGKTSLLDAIRGANTVEDEAGGITQHISAYQITHSGRKITFLDTPGHEAFASLRQHGAHLTDLVILVVAADDGVKPQTKEAIKFAQQAGVKIMVALNKIDKPGANVNRVLQELSDSGLSTEQWGGDTVVVEVSATKKTGLDKLLEMALLITDVEELTADEEGAAEGIVIEGHMEQGRGPVVSVLVEHGQLKPGDFVSAGSVSGKVRTLTDYTGVELKFAGPSTPATITGMKHLPDFGAVFYVHPNEKAARAAAEAAQTGADSSHVATTGSELLAQIHKNRMAQELPVIVKADVRGSMTSVVDALKKLKNEEISVRLVTAGVGNIGEGDVMTAAAAQAIIYGFNVAVPTNIKRLALQEGVSLRLYKIIYELIDDATKELEERIVAKVVETEVGRLIVKGVFKISPHDLICGGEVTKGKVTAGIFARVERGDKVLGEAEVIGVQKGQVDAKEAVAGDMCGLQLKTITKINLKLEDRLEFFQRENVKSTLDSKNA